MTCLGINKSLVEADIETSKGGVGVGVRIFPLKGLKITRKAVAVRTLALCYNFGPPRLGLRRKRVKRAGSAGGNRGRPCKPWCCHGTVTTYTAGLSFRERECFRFARRASSGRRVLLPARLVPGTLSWGYILNICYKYGCLSYYKMGWSLKGLTGVLPERQKLLGLKVKGKPADNDVKLGSLKLKPNTKIMMMGTREESLEDVLGPPPDNEDVVNDFDIEEEVVEVENREENLLKISRRVKEYKVEILNPPREGKKLLVLDVDYTLFDHRSCAETGLELMRPYLHEFLTSAYEDYDIVIWSATNMKWIEAKMKELGVSTNANYKITFMLDSAAMITVHTPRRGLIDVKPLGVIWGKFSEFYSKKNTIMFDDIGRNFLMNPQNGLKIKPFMKAHLNRDKDKELLKLTQYLKEIAKLDDFLELNHKHWERYLSKKQGQ
ncbi:ubiquitin-like domain-containing CTD phosphatase 1 [Podarcis lilfordi]|uniref:Ubiquitin-like domain-containing CTD phosphatase 1 n=1 Tax=Podarcis lilfordi TaxID=74358 RepID=A0AA35P081_9SAUR|nr:ubiquitin-like domain-containing CTD phosphatase 1 [Podarcis lilfordi]